MRRIALPIYLLSLLVLATGCARRPPAPPLETVRVPPRIDLKQLELIGLVEFESTAEGELGPLTTRLFADAARQDQGLVRMVEIERRDVGAELDPEEIERLEREHDLNTILTGVLTISKIRPKLSTDLRSGSIEGQLEATLAVRMIEASTGASIWSASARATRKIGSLSLFSGGQLVFDAEDPEGAYGDLVGPLVEQVTRDFRVRWERR